VRQRAVIGIYGESGAVSRPVAQVFEQVMKTFPRSPPDRVLRLLADQDAISRHNPAEREINKVANPHIDVPLESAVALGRSHNVIRRQWDYRQRPRDTHPID
jgi:hypothetical protein